MVATGMHHGLIALYTFQLQELGYVTLYPALTMAGAGLVGASLAIRLKAKKAGNHKLCKVGDSVTAGQLIMKAELGTIAAGLSPIVIVVECE